MRLTRLRRLLTQTLALGYLDSRYTDVEQIVDVLVGFAYCAAPPAVLPAT